MRKALAVLALIGLAACGGPAEPVWAPDDAVLKYRYSNGAPELRLFTVVSTRNGSGAHSGLLVSADERVIFDPAGTFSLPFVPERNDVHHGMDENALKVYIDYHARETFDVVEQRIPVTPAQAAEVARLVKSYGAVPKAQCSLAITRVLSQVPGLESVPVTYFPNTARKAVARIPGVKERVITDSDSDKNHNVLFRAVSTQYGG